MASTISMALPSVYAAEIPSWIKNNAGWWASDQIDDNTFVSGIQWLVSNDIIQVPSTTISGVSESAIPNWIKNNAGWWADDIISDNDFVNGIQYLIKVGIIVIPQMEKSVIETTTTYTIENPKNYPDWLINNPSWQSARILTNSDFSNFNTQYLKEKVSGHEDVHINSHGFRGPEFSEQKPNNTYRIFVLGGSSTFGHSVVDDETWSTYLQKKFDQTDLKFNVEVINAGINKANSRTEAKLIEDRLVDFDPDLVIMYDGWNDASCNVISNPAYCLEQFDPGLNAPREEDSFDSNVHSMKKSEQTLQNWKSVCKLGNEKGFDTIITVQPMVGAGNRVPIKDILDIFPFYNYYDFVDEPFYKNANKKPSDLTPVENMYPKLSLYVEYLEQLKEDCTKVADFRAIFDYIQEPIYYDVGHITPLGNKILAEHFFAMVLSILHEDLNKHTNSNHIPNYNYTPSTNDQLTPGNFVGPIITDADNQITPYAPNIELMGKNFEGLDLKNAVFYNSDLTDANFQDANLSNAFFYRANLKNVNFQSADLSDADFGLANIDGANFQDANLDGTQFYHVKFAGIDISNANNVERADLSHSNLSGAILTHVDLAGRDLSYTNLSGQDLSDKDLTKTVLIGSDLTNTILSNDALSGKNLTNTIFNGVDLSGKNISRSDFSNSKLENTNLENANLSLSMFVDVDFTKIKNKSLAGADLTDTSFAYANLSGVNLAGAKTIFNNFHKANLSGTDFTVISKASVTGSIFDGANLSNANFEGVKFFDDRVWMAPIESYKQLPYNTVIVEKLSDGYDVLVQYIIYSDFNEANLQNANFSNAYLANADLTNADLTNANLNGANLNEAILNCLNHPICIKD